MVEVIHADLELWLSGYVRTRLAARDEPVTDDVEVDVKEPLPTDEWPTRLVVIRYDGSVETSILTDEASVGVTVFAGSKALPQDANDLARIVRAIIRGAAGLEPGNPVAAVLETTGPFPVTDEGPRARRYLTARFSVTGQEF